jgi:hypothetical protein
MQKLVKHSRKYGGRLEFYTKHAEKVVLVDMTEEEFSTYNKSLGLMIWNML